MTQGIVFISYSHLDLFAACIFELWIREAGYIPVRDESSFRAGPIPEEIERHITECDLFLAVLSQRFHKSSWVRDEIEQAHGLQKRFLYVAIERCLPKPPDKNEIPLELWKKDASVWRVRFAEEVRRKLADSGDGDFGNLETWVLSRVGCNQWVRDRVQYENIASSRFFVSSTVELAAKWTGWTRDDIRASKVGEFQPEQEVLDQAAHLNVRLDTTDKDNFALKSLREDLTDEHGLQLNFQRISHNLVRFVGDEFAAIDNSMDPRRHLFELGNLAFPNSVVVHMVLVTSDDYLIICHRSSRPRFYENCWSATYEEHMRASSDGRNPFKTAIRGLREELVGEGDRVAVTVDAIRFFSVFRELDFWTNIDRGESFWDVNVGLAGLIRVPFPVQTIFRNWLASVPNPDDPDSAPDNVEFRHVVAIPYTFANLFRLLTTPIFDPGDFETNLLVPPGVNPSFPDCARKPEWTRQHPTNQIRIVRCLTYGFLDSLTREFERCANGPKPSVDTRA